MLFSKNSDDGNKKIVYFTTIYIIIFVKKNFSSLISLRYTEDPDPSFFFQIYFSFLFSKLAKDLDSPQQRADPQPCIVNYTYSLWISKGSYCVVVTVRVPQSQVYRSTLKLDSKRFHLKILILPLWSLG